jgi:hypothetical protein
VASPHPKATTATARSFNCVPGRCGPDTAEQTVAGGYVLFTSFSRVRTQALDVLAPVVHTRAQVEERRGAIGLIG